jgi:hypothetical protein
MGGKGGGRNNYYEPPPSTSGNATLEEAEKTLKNAKPLDLEGYQSNINVKKAANDATAKVENITPPAEQTPVESTSGTETTKDDTSTGALVGKAILNPPGFWAGYGTAPNSVINNDPTTNTTQI